MFLIDTSWSNTFGEHFNRVVIDAMRTGTIPIAINYGVSDNEQGNGVLLKANQNYLMIPKGSTPKQYADLIKGFCDISESEYNRIQQNNYELVKLFDRKKIAQQYIDLANGVPTGMLSEFRTKTNFDPSIIREANNIFDKHFAVNQSLEEFFGT